MANFTGRDIGNLCSSVTAFEPGRIEGVKLEHIRCEIAGGLTTNDWDEVFTTDPAGYPSRLRTRRVPAYGLYTQNAGEVRVVDFTVTPSVPDTRPFAGGDFPSRRKR